MMMVGQALAPGLLDRLLARFGISSQRTGQPATDGGAGNLDAPRTDDNRVEGDYSDHARRFSLYTWMETHPAARLLAGAGVLVGTVLLASRARRNGSAMRRLT
jgi:hypothetical protein